jgi:CubicO group peptidase (beta-lactamase class C family)
MALKVRIHQRYHTVPALTVTGLCLTLLSSIARADRVDDYIHERMEREHIPGLSLAVVHDGKIVKACGYGYADLERNVRATPQTVYQLASVSKQFTAAGIMLLVQDGKIDLDAPLSTYISGTPDTWKEITIRELLTHTSGMAREPADKSGRTYRDDIPEDEMLRIAESMPLLTPPGTRYSYSNLGYNLLGMVIERVSGKPYAQYMHDRIFGPVGMTATRLNDLHAILKNRACGYQWANDRLRGAETISPTHYFGAGGIISNVLDLARWDMALYNESPLTSASRSTMWSKMPLKDGKTSDYGFGWNVSSVKGHDNLNHDGLLDGFQTFFTRYPKDSLSVIVLLNLTGGGSPVQIGRGVARFYLPDIRPEPKKTIHADPAAFAALEGRYEFDNNDMLTLHRVRAVLDGRRGDGYDVSYAPIGPDLYWEDDLGSTLRVVRDSTGSITGLGVKRGEGKERIIPKIGPLPSSVASQPDPDAARTARVLSALMAMKAGGAEIQQSSALSAGAKTDFSPGPVADLDGMRGIIYIAAMNVAGRGIERHGSKVDTVLYYKMQRDIGDCYLQIYLTSDGLVTDEDVVPD